MRKPQWHKATRYEMEAKTWRWQIFLKVVQINLYYEEQIFP